MKPLPPAESAGGRRLGSLLVTAQFALIGALAALAAPAFLAGAVPAVAWALVVGGGALGVWSVQAMRLGMGNFNIRPTPPPDGQLVERGPYRWIRHPMYTSVGLIATGCAVAAGSAAGLLAALGLAAVLRVKAAVEERWMAERHPGYTDYRSRTRRFLPGIY